MAHVEIFEIQKSLSSRNAGGSLRRALLGAGLAVLLGGGYYVWHANSQGGAPAAPPPAQVTVETLQAHSVAPFAQFSGRISAVDYAEVRPEVAGRITGIRFKNGQQVKAGDILFVIEPAAYEAAAAKAAADLQSAKVNAALAHATLKRYDSLLKQNAIAPLTYDQSVNAAQVADAAIASSAAALAQAKVDVDHAYVKAPISGKISRAEITLGNYVGSPTAPPPVLASIMSNDGVYADFEVDEQTYLNNVRAAHGTANVPVELTIQGDSHVYKGVVESFDNHIASGSGTIRARARFANDDGALVPGMFVAVRMGGAVQRNVLTVPESAIGNDQSKRFVFVATKANRAEYREVTLGDTVDGERVVLTGLKPGDRVILDGLQKLAPGAPISPTSASPQTKS
jgi:multidrug efflux system membrane fusion protein